MHVQHDPVGVNLALVEDRLQHHHHEFLRGVVVVVKEHLVERRTLGLRALLDLDPFLALRIGRAFVFGRHLS